MTLSPGDSRTARPRLGELRMAGEWACAHGDFSALRQVARGLAGRLPAQVNGDLAALADSCIADPERAAALWDRVRAEALRARAP